MTRPRKDIVSKEITPYYHLISRTVRGAYLTGTDLSSQRNYSHRREWIVDRLKQLANIFALNIHAFTVNPHEYHLIIEIDSDRVDIWSDEFVIEKWTQVYKGPELIQKYKSGQELDDKERSELARLAGIWRVRLAELGWFMKCLNQHIAHLANREDNCRGHFWLSRYKSRPLKSALDIEKCNEKWGLTSFVGNDKEPEARDNGVEMAQ